MSVFLEFSAWVLFAAAIIILVLFALAVAIGLFQVLNDIIAKDEDGRY